MGKNKELKVYRTSSVEESLNELRNKDERFRILFDSFDIEDQVIARLVELRKEAGLSQRDLAKLTGMKQPQIARYETGDESPRLDTFIRILEALNYKITLEKKSLKKESSSRNSEVSLGLAK